MVKLLIKDKKLSQGDKIQLGISYFLQATLIIALFLATYEKQWENLFAISGILLLTLLPSILRRSYRVRLPVEMDFIIIIFIYAALFLGEIHTFFTKLWWWDLLLHSSSGVLMGLTGFLLVYVLNSEEKVHLNLKPFFVAVFSFAFAIAIGVVWEIFEFTMDSSFGLNMQKSGLTDTMGDLIVNFMGALLISLLGFFYLKKQSLTVDKWIHDFLTKNVPLGGRKLQ